MTLGVHNYMVLANLRHLVYIYILPCVYIYYIYTVHIYIRCDTGCAYTVMANPSYAGRIMLVAPVSISKYVWYKHPVQDIITPM